MRLFTARFLTALTAALLTTPLVGQNGGAAEASGISDAEVKLQELRALVRGMPNVIAELRGGYLTLLGWTSGEGERAALTNLLKGRTNDVVDLTTEDVGDPYRMVEVDVVLFLVRSSTVTSEGFNFLRLINVRANAFSADYKRDGPGFVAPGSRGTVDALSQQGWVGLASADYDVNIANANDTEVAILARPHLTSLNGEEAKFLAGGEIVFEVQGIEAGDIKPYPFGISITVTPTVLRTSSDDGSPKIMVDIQATRTSILDLALEADNAVFDKTEVSSMAVLALDETLILSGLYQIESRKIRTGVPLLRDIPVLKYFFSTESELETKESAIILVTPRDPALLNEERNQAIARFIERREAWTKASQGTAEERARFRAEYPEWYKPAPNRYASHFFLMEKSELYRNVQVSDLSVESLEFEILDG